ncbi:MAG: 3-deoxy-D-manno-octulosonate 8-phosphate phosphatase KdsC [Planctomycetes bacterium]|nr:3-deoxy-D-manno-octulosonate 8-phosphate phosphatase KdsC [Planctomycetota bacterium]
MRSDESRVARAFAALPGAIRAAFQRVELLVLDVDGVLTDGRIAVAADGTESLAFHVRDSSGLWQWKKAGFRSAAVTGRGSGIPERAASLLPFAAIRSNALDKAAALRSVLEELEVSADRIAYVGDDLLDGPALRMAGLPIVVGDAEPDLAPLASYVTRRHGGCGAVREVTDLLLEARGLRAPLLAERLGERGSGA